jgi:hypothetical protein
LRSGILRPFYYGNCGLLDRIVNLSWVHADDLMFARTSKINPPCCRPAN